MNNEKDAFSKVFEEALNKSIEANKVFLNESTRFFRQFTSRDGASKLNLFQGDALSNAFSQYMKLNLDHFNNLVDLGVNFIRDVNNTPGPATAEETGSHDPNQPSFVLEKEVTAGGQVNFQFLLDNVKQEPVNCQLIHTGFALLSGGPMTDNIRIIFMPAVFELQPGESKSINIEVYVPAETIPNLYITKVQVKGFEPAYFSVQVNVIESTNQPKADGGKQDKSKRK